MAMPDEVSAKLFQELGSAMGQLSALNANVANLNRQMEGAGKGIARIETQVESLRLRVSSIAGRIERGDDAFESLRKAQDNHEGRLATVEKKHEGMRGIWWTLTQLGIAGIISWVVARATGKA